MSDTNTLSTWGDFAPRPVMLEVETDYGHKASARILPLTAEQWGSIGAEVETPPEPANKTPKAMAAYRRRVDEAEDERSYRRLVVALEGGGNLLEGETLAEKVESLKRVTDNGIVMSLWLWLLAASSGANLRVVSVTVDGGQTESEQPEAGE